MLEYTVKIEEGAAGRLSIVITPPKEPDCTNMEAQASLVLNSYVQEGIEAIAKTGSKAEIVEGPRAMFEDQKPRFKRGGLG